MIYFYGKVKQQSKDLLDEYQIINGIDTYDNKGWVHECSTSILKHIIPHIAELDIQVLYLKGSSKSSTNIIDLLNFSLENNVKLMLHVDLFTKFSKSIKNLIKDHPAFYGIFLHDEPHALTYADEDTTNYRPDAGKLNWIADPQNSKSYPFLKDNYGVQLYIVYAPVLGREYDSHTPMITCAYDEDLWYQYASRWMDYTDFIASDCYPLRTFPYGTSTTDPLLTKSCYTYPSNVLIQQGDNWISTPVICDNKLYSEIGDWNNILVYYNYLKLLLRLHKEHPEKHFGGWIQASAFSNEPVLNTINLRFLTYAYLMIGCCDIEFFTLTTHSYKVTKLETPAWVDYYNHKNTYDDKYIIKSGNDNYAKINLKSKISTSGTKETWLGEDGREYEVNAGSTFALVYVVKMLYKINTEYYPDNKIVEYKGKYYHIISTLEALFNLEDGSVNQDQFRIFKNFYSSAKYKRYRRIMRNITVDSFERYNGLVVDDNSEASSSNLTVLELEKSSFFHLTTFKKDKQQEFIDDVTNEVFVSYGHTTGITASKYCSILNLSLVHPITVDLIENNYILEANNNVLITPKNKSYTILPGDMIIIRKSTNSITHKDVTFNKGGK